MFNLSIIQNRQAEAEQPKFLFQSRKKHSRDQVVGIGVGFLGTSAFGQCGSYPPILFFSSNSQKKIFSSSSGRHRTTCFESGDGAVPLGAGPR
jgi:hypothetical protein